MKNAKILAIDDNADNLIVLKALLQDAFPEIKYISALSGEIGIALSLSERPDVIITDIVMPTIDGFEVCRILKSHESTRTIPLIMLTAARTDKESRIKALEMGADAFLTKPVDESELTAQIRAMLRIKEAEDLKLNEKEQLQKLVEERTRELELNQKQLRGIFENLQDAYFQADESGNFVMISPSALRMYNYNSLDELLGKPASTYYYDHKDWESILQLLHNLGRIEDFVCLGKKKDGSPFWVSINIQLLRNDVGQIEGTEGVVRDITERKRAENLVKKSEERFRHISSSISDISFSCIADLDGISSIDWLYGATEKITGYTVAEFFQMKCWGKLVIEEDFPVFKKHIIDALPGISEQCQLRLKKKDGNIAWVQASAHCVDKSDFNGSKIIYGGLVDITKQKQSEEALREREQLFRALFNASPDAILLIDPNHPVISWPIVDCNVAACQMNGYLREEMIGQSIDLLNIISRTREERIAYLNELQQVGIIRKEGLYRHKKGHIFPIEISNSIVTINGKEMVLEIFRDITDRKKAELALKESEERYRGFVSQVSEGVYRFECNQPIDITLPLEEQIDAIYIQMFIAECNEAFMKMYGFTSQEEMIGRGYVDFYGGQFNDTNREIMRSFILNGYRTENAITVEFGAQGQKIYFSNNSLGIIENNCLVRVWGTQIDITEKTKADQIQQILYTISNATLSSNDLAELIEIICNELGKLLDTNNFFIAFHDEATNMLSTIYEKDEKDAIQTWPAEKSLTGYVIKNKRSMLLKEADMISLVDSGEVEIYGTMSKVWLGVPLSLKKKVIGAIVVQSYDIPEAFTEKDKLMLEFVSHQISISVERKKAEQELNAALTRAKESDRLKSAFLANMSHEIRTPLNSIIGFADLMLDPGFDREQYMDFAKVINSSGNSLLTIISDIMDFSKIEAGQIIINKIPFAVQKLISSVQKEYSRIAVEKGIELRIKSTNPKEEIWIRSDENRMRQVLVNLVSNAVKFTNEGYVEIGLESLDTSIQVHVMDTGIGIPEEFHNTIFERFRQVESANTRKHGGNGLGLAISKSLIELLDGHIWVESECGKGSKFTFTIPKILW